MSGALEHFSWTIVGVAIVSVFVWWRLVSKRKGISSEGIAAEVLQTKKESKKPHVTSQASKSNTTTKNIADVGKSCQSETKRNMEQEPGEDPELDNQTSFNTTLKQPHSVFENTSQPLAKAQSKDNTTKETTGKPVTFRKRPLSSRSRYLTRSLSVDAKPLANNDLGMRRDGAQQKPSIQLQTVQDQDHSYDAELLKKARSKRKQTTARPSRSYAKHSTETSSISNHSNLKSGATKQSSRDRYFRLSRPTLSKKSISVGTYGKKEGNHISSNHAKRQQLLIRARKRQEEKFAARQKEFRNLCTKVLLQRCLYFTFNR